MYQNCRKYEKNHFLFLSGHPRKVSAEDRKRNRRLLQVHGDGTLNANFPWMREISKAQVRYGDHFFFQTSSK